MTRKISAACLALIWVATISSTVTAAGSADSAYLQARATYHDLLRSAEKRKSVPALKKTISLYKSFAHKYPTHEKCPDALYNVGRIYELLFKVSHDSDNMRAGIAAFDQLVRLFPKNNLADDSLFHAARYSEDYLHQPQAAEQYRALLRRDYSEGDMVALLGVAGETPSLPSRTIIVVDPGHGGDDPGAIGIRGLEEKSITLKISRQLKRELENRHHYKVTLTRTRDQTLTLEERDQTVARTEAELFISIHANASTDPKVHGIQTYYLNNASDEASKRLASRENAGRSKKVSDVKGILASLVQNDVTEESALLARSIHAKILLGVGQRYKEVHDLKVKTALFYVLVGAKVPSVLVETAFITNPQEGARLKDEKYQKLLATAIADGIENYLNKRAQELKDL